MKEDLSKCLGARFRRLSRIVTRKFNEGLKEFDLHISQVNILFAVTMNPGVRQSQVGEYLSLQRSTLSREITRLVKDDLIYTQVEQGSKSPVLFLTKKGESLVARVEVVWQGIQDELEDALGVKTLDHFKKIENQLIT